MKVSSEMEDWREIVYCGLENQQIDFKSPQDWNEIGRTGRAKFARHAIALANTMGGYVVVGVGEDANGNPTNYIGMTEAQASSFDPSAVGQTINRYADPSVSLDIVRPEIDGKLFVIIVVRPFRDIPHVCGDACDDELQRGVFYIRTPDARSRAAIRASELHGLIQRALRNQRQMLGRMLRGILYEDRQAETDQNAIVFPPLVERSRKQAKEKLGNAAMREMPLFESVCYPLQPFDSDSLTSARRGFDALEQPRMVDFPWIGTQMRSSVYATNESICGQQLDVKNTPLCFWEYYPNGLFYSATPLPVERINNEKYIDADKLLQLLLVTVSVIGQLYSNLNHQNAVLNIAIRLANSNLLHLGGLKNYRPEGKLVCQILDVDVSKQRSAGDLDAGADTDIASQLFLEICERFNATFDSADYAEIKVTLDNFVAHGMLRNPPSAKV